MECIECYSENNRITPLLDSRSCLEAHEQYICSTCGRCICIDKDENRNVQRWNFPFKSLEIAKLYLRTADLSTKEVCGIYEIVASNGRKAYKIFADTEHLGSYLNKNKNKSCKNRQPLYKKEVFREFPETRIKRLDKNEVEKYLSEQES